MAGWFSVERQIFDHEMFDGEPYSRRDAWLWLIANAAWKDTTHRIGNNVVNVLRGSFYTTIRQLMSKWQWGNSKVMGFMRALQAQHMIEAEIKTGKTLITICNYDDYQRADLPDKTAVRHEQDTKVINKQINNNTNKQNKRAREADFDIFWEQYPHKVGKGAARKAFEGIQKSNKANLQELIDGLSRYVQTKPPDRNWCNPATWLNQERWGDEPALPINGHMNGGARETAAERNKREYENERSEIMEEIQNRNLRVVQ